MQPGGGQDLRIDDNESGYLVDESFSFARKGY